KPINFCRGLRKRLSVLPSRGLRRAGSNRALPMGGCFRSCALLHQAEGLPEADGPGRLAAVEQAGAGDIRALLRGRRYEADDVEACVFGKEAQEGLIEKDQRIDSPLPVLHQVAEGV